MEILGGPLFGVAGAGESHGPAITTIVFGCPPGLRIARQEIQKYLDRRRPGSSKHGTPRSESDKVVLLAGIYAEGELDTLLSGPDIQILVDGQEYQTEAYEEGFSTGEPIAAIVLSTSKKSRHYEQYDFFHKLPHLSIRDYHCIVQVKKSSSETAPENRDASRCSQPLFPHT